MCLSHGESRSTMSRACMRYQRGVLLFMGLSATPSLFWGLRDFRQKSPGPFASYVTALSKCSIFGLWNSNQTCLGEVFLSGAWHEAENDLQKRI